MSEAQMRTTVAELQPGDKVSIDHEVKVGMKIWHTKTVGTVVQTERRRHSLHHDRNFDDYVWSDCILLQKEEGELTTIMVDEFTQVEVLAT